MTSMRTRGRTRGARAAPSAVERVLEMKCKVADRSGVRTEPVGWIPREDPELFLELQAVEDERGFEGVGIRRQPCRGDQPASTEGQQSFVKTKHLSITIRVIRTLLRCRHVASA